MDAIIFAGGRLIALGLALAASLHPSRVLATEPGKAPSTEQLECPERAHREHVAALALSKSGELLVSGSRDQTIKVWRLPERRVALHLDEYFSALALSSDGGLLAAAVSGGSIKLWRLPAGTLIKTIDAGSTQIRALVMSADDQVLISGNDRGFIDLWSLPNGSRLGSLSAEAPAITALSLSTNKTLLASGSSDGTIRVWSLPDRTIKQTMAGYSGSPNVLVLSPDGKFVAAGGQDNQLRVWPLNDPLLFKILAEPSGPPRALALSADGDVLVSGSDDRTVRLWRLSAAHVTPAATILKTPKSGAIFALVLASDGDQLIAADGAGHLQVRSLSGARPPYCLVDDGPRRAETGGHKTEVKKSPFSTLLVFALFFAWVMLAVVLAARLFSSDSPVREVLSIRCLVEISDTRRVEGLLSSGLSLTAHYVVSELENDVPVNSIRFHRRKVYCPGCKSQLVLQTWSIQRILLHWLILMTIVLVAVVLGLVSRGFAFLDDAIYLLGAAMVFGVAFLGGWFHLMHERHAISGARNLHQVFVKKSDGTWKPDGTS